MKRGARAKSRLAVDPGLRTRLARAFTADTVSALQSSDRVAGVVAVVGAVEGGVEGPDGHVEESAEVGDLRSAGVRIVAEPAPTAGELNAALRAGIAAVHGAVPGAPIAIVLGDLPALQPLSVSRALDIALRTGGAVFVADASGHGTTLLAGAEQAPEPLFGVGSAARHRTGGAIEISALVSDDLRCDVDTAADLDVAVSLGVGPATRAVLAGRVSPPRP